MTLKITGTTDEVVDFIRGIGMDYVTLEESEYEEDEEND